MKALILACILGASCGPKAKVFGTTLGACELGKLPSTLQTVIADVAGILMAGSADTWQHDLSQLGTQVGVQQISCVVEAVGAGIRGKIRKGQAAPEYVEAAKRADEWAAGEKK